MLTAEGCRQRRQRLWDQLEEKPDWILVSDPRHLNYLTGFYASPFSFRSNGAGAVLILGREGESILVTDNVLDVYADAAHVDEVVAHTWYDCSTTAPHRQALLFENALERLKQCSGSVFGFEATVTPTAVVHGVSSERQGIRWYDIDPVLHRLKRQKDPDELVLIQRAMDAGTAGFAAARENVRAGMTEQDFYQVVLNAAIKEAGEPVILYGDFVSGPRTAEVGGPPTHRVIEKGDMLLLDCSVVVDGYRGDFANAWICEGTPTTEQQRRCDACLEAMRLAEAMLKPGTSCQEIHRAVEASFEEKGLLELFPHHTGHGLGLGHPDAPFLVGGSLDTLLEGDIVTLEPGLYSEEVGGMRFEHNYLITAEGPQQLSGHHLGL
ncbi:putative peptidase [Planctomycetes bacterium Pan216]|uniref:Putative peptidase n=1 Tax=Kolteria novifilia TaxID=2527975 RepID=A0A518B804_9BACT|nr:putative peptidase [Planctomycetes bacterium Pan216]